MTKIKKEFKTEEEAVAYTIPILAAGKHRVDALALPDGTGWCVTTIEKKTYIAHDGKEYVDEVWADESGEIHLIQDLSESHAKNIIRFMIRREYQRSALMEEIAKQMAASLEDMFDSNNDEMSDIPDSTSISSTTDRILH